MSDRRESVGTFKVKKTGSRPVPSIADLLVRKPSAHSEPMRGRPERSRSPAPSISVAEVLSHADERVRRTEFWKGAVERHLPSDIVPHVVHVVEDKGCLTLYCDSGAWVSRLKYLLFDVGKGLKACATPPCNVTEIKVKVMPQGRAR